MENWIYRIKCGTMCCWQIITFSNDPAGSLATSLLKSSNDKLMSA